MRRVLASALMPAVLLAVAPAGAADPASPPPHISVRLAYEHGPGIEGCPDERGLRYALMAQFGYDPTEAPAIFDFEPPPLLRVVFSRQGAELRAVASLVKDSGRVLWGDQYQGRIECADLARNIALVIKIGIEAADVPRRPVAPPAVPMPTSSPPPAAPPVVEPPSPTKPPPSPWPKIRAGLGAGIAFGAAPAPAVGFSGQIGIRWARFSLALEGRADLPASSDALGLRTSLVVGTLLPCVHVLAYGIACALVSAGARRTALLEGTSHTSTPYVGAGARLGIEVPFAGRWAARLSGDLIGTAVPTVVRLGLEKTVQWTSPPVAGGPAIGLLVNF